MQRFNLYNGYQQMLVRRWKTHRLLHTNASLQNKSEHSTENFAPNVVSESASEGEEEEPVFFSQDKDILPEVEIKPFKQIRKETATRFRKRYMDPSLKWYSKMDPENSARAQDLLKFGASPTELFDISKKWLSSESVEINNGTETDGSRGMLPDARFYFKPSNIIDSSLQAGDLCVLRSNKLELVMCVKEPSEVMDARFAFAKADGSILYAGKSSVHLRFPSLYSKNDLGLVQTELKHGYNPIGSIKNDKNTTFMIPTLARRMMVSNILFKVSSSANDMVPMMKKKLELLHRYLQSNTGPWQLPLFKLAELCSNLTLTSNIETSLANAFLKSGISSKALYSLADSHFDLSTKLPEKIECSHFLAVYWALLHQQDTQMWGKLATHRGIFFPTSITVLPLSSQHLHYHSLIYKLKKYDGALISRIANLINSNKLAEVNHQFPSLITLLRDYAAGNFNENAIVTSLIASLFRQLDTYKAMHLSRDTCFQLLKHINPGELPNPLWTNHELQLPINNERVKLEQKIYDLAVPEDIPSQMENRTEYKDLICYCIDSADAHEIDDAISISSIGNSKYRIYIHVADPASLFPQANNIEASKEHPILDVAYQRAFTTYLPDKVFPMLPTCYARIADLGHYDKPTKGVTFSVDCNFSKTGGLELFDETLKVELSILHKSKRTTYEAVDTVLGSVSKTNQEENDLNTLFSIAKALRKDRVTNRGAVLFENSQTGVVSLSPDENGELTEVSFKDSVETKSTVLVTELMILANSLAASYFEKSKIPGIFRGYRPLNVVEGATEIYDWVKEKTRQGKLLSKADITKMKSFLTSSFYTSKPTRHEMIGSANYLTVTSPLRRFPDLINHLQLHRHLRNLPPIYTQQDLNGMMWHILARDISIKDASTEAQIYWTLNYLKEKIKDPTKNSWKVLITSLTELGYAHCTVFDKSFGRGQLKIDPNKKPLLVGDTVSNCQITNIACLDGILNFEFTSESKVDRKS